ncbi:MAG: 1-deoxy-D-xylulose-5-phosphate reductoisomerase [Treponema sp. CETP13]|nr:MAG: 1-deoxy-D-xylulose-5-phosphate reductoisomerase [Treponema sp. CETP13]
MKKIVVLGCTGSIGTSTLNIIREFPDRFTVCGLTAHTKRKELYTISKEFDCLNALLTSEDENASKKVIANSDADIVVNGIAGAAGLAPSVYTLQQGIDLALANKETIVMAGSIIKKLASTNHCRILPVDSEHSAIFNLIENYGHDAVDSIIITASGGPFRTWPKDKLASIKPEDALKHPTWDMGQKITIDSASLANKGLEVIEASKLFDIPANKIKVTVHPQSIIHSLIQTKDGVLYGQLSKPDMRHPILSALSWPEYVPNSLEKLDLTALIGTASKSKPSGEGLNLQFFPPRLQDFPMLNLAYKALETKGAYTIAYNAANEIAVAAFLQNSIKFTDIPIVTQSVLKADWHKNPVTFDDVLLFDEKARQLTQTVIAHL